MKNVLKSIICIVVIFIQLFIACTSAEKDWENASKANTLEAYSKIQLDHPNTKFDSLAADKIKSISKDLIDNSIAQFFQYKFDSSEILLIRVLKADSTNLFALNNLGALQKVKKNNELADKYLQRALKVAPDTLKVNVLCMFQIQAGFNGGNKYVALYNQDFTNPKVSFEEKEGEIMFQPTMNVQNGQIIMKFITNDSLSTLLNVSNLAKELTISNMKGGVSGNI